MRISNYIMIILLFMVLFVLGMPIFSEAKSIDGYDRSSDAIYGLGFIGAAIYYLSNARSFWQGVLGFLKAVVWPVFLVYDLLKFLKSD